MRVLEGLKPESVFRYFEDIAGIPHGSYNEKALSDYCVEFAKAHHFRYTQDELFNVIIFCPASEGYEDEPGVILQGHLDMVCEKEDGFDFDFEKDGLKLKTDGKDIYAEGTTLGGDDGIAIAYALALMDDETVKHPALTAVFTVSEETGMEGASGIDLSRIKARRLLNLDSEEEGVFTVGCAGGCRAECDLPLEKAEVTGIGALLTVKGAYGGHSGGEIIRGGANANLILARLLHAIRENCRASSEGSSETDALYIVQMEGGNKDNAIPRNAAADIVVSQDAVDTVIRIFTREAKSICHEYSKRDPDLEFELSFQDGEVLRISEKASGEPGGDSALRKNEGESESIKKPLISGKRVTEKAWTKATMDKALLILLSIPNGLQSLTPGFGDLPETSLSLGVMRTGEDCLSLRYALRSSVGSAKQYLSDRIRLIVTAAGGEFKVGGVYPEWEIAAKSDLRDELEALFEEMYGKKPRIEAVHGGLECGIITHKLPGVDAVSLGPDMVGIHTTEEKLNIESVARVWEFILRFLAQKHGQ